MYPIISIILVLILAFGLGNQIKKHPGIFYTISVLITIGICIYYRAGLWDIYPQWFTDYITNPFKRGAFSTALFILVMYTGVLNPKWTVTKKLYKIRGELSIIACIITLGHNFIYGKKHFPNLFFHASEMELNYLIATSLTIILILLMLPLMITSFPMVRKKMNVKTWKNVQKLAYPFFALIYIHIMTVFVPKAEKKWFEIIIYTIIFSVYLVLRIRKAYKVKSKKYKSTISTASI